MTNPPLLDQLSTLGLPAPQPGFGNDPGLDAVATRVAAASREDNHSQAINSTVPVAWKPAKDPRLSNSIT